MKPIRSSIVNRYVRPKTLISAEAKKLLIKNLFNYLNDIQSLSTVVLNSRIDKKMYGFPIFSHFIKQPSNRLYPKNRLECIGKAVMMLYLG